MQPLCVLDCCTLARLHASIHVGRYVYVCERVSEWNGPDAWQPAAVQSRRLALLGINEITAPAIKLN